MPAAEPEPRNAAPRKTLLSRLRRLPLLDRLYVLYLDVCVYVCNHIVGHLPSFALRHCFYRRVMRWRIGRQSNIHERLRISGVPGRGSVTVGDNAAIGVNLTLIGPGMRPDGSSSVTIGHNVGLASDVHLITGGHRLATDGGFDAVFRPVRIEDHAVVLTRAMIIMCAVGRGAVVLPGSVVTRDVKPFEIVGGVPARKIGTRRPQRDPGYRLNWRWRFH